MEGLDSREIVIGDVHFTIGKLLPKEAKALYEILRPELAGVAARIATIDFDEGDPRVKIGEAVGLVVGGLSPPVLAAAEKEVFKHVRYTSPSNQASTVLLGDEDSAFKDLDVIHMYEVLVRCLAVNFIGSWSAIQSRFPQLAGAMGLALEMSTPSSPTPSTQGSAATPT